jgi:MFS transporter, BCD family, chlorophyll transporter
VTQTSNDIRMGASRASRPQDPRGLRRWMPFADAVSDELPLARLLRLALFQVSCGMTAVMLTGTLNRVMMVELSMPGWIVALMVSIPLLVAPFRALIGFRSDVHRSVFGWRRTPYVWFGSLLQFGGLAIMPFALLILTGNAALAGKEPGYLAAALGFLMAGAGLHVVQTAGLAMATDVANDATRAQVVAAHYVMLLVGMMISSVVFGTLLVDFTAMRLIQVIQGAAVLALVLNVVAMWRQEGKTTRTVDEAATGGFKASWQALTAQPQVKRLLVAVGLGAAGFAAQDVLLEPYGGQILGLSVSGTTLLTALWALGTLVGFVMSSRRLGQGRAEPHRIAGMGALVGVFAFTLVVMSGAVHVPALFYAGVAFVGFGGGLFSVGTLTSAMVAAQGGLSGLALGAWGAVQATASGIAIALAGLVRDGLGGLATSGALGPGLSGPATGYMAVYIAEIILLFVTLVAIGPLARHAPDDLTRRTAGYGLAEFPT